MEILNRLKKRPTARSLFETGIKILLFWAGIYFIPHNWCARGAPEVFDNRGDIQNHLAAHMEEVISKDIGRKDFKTGSELFDGEWLFGTYMMSGLGFGQMALLHPEQKERYCALMGKCVAGITSPAVREFDTVKWHGDNPLESLDSNKDHAAYLGYLNLLLSFHRLLDKESKYSELNDRITAALARRLNESPHKLLQTYPMEVYPVDNCAVIASIGLYDKATGANHSTLLNQCMAKMKNEYTDEKTGLLYQYFDPFSGGHGPPRGSGTCLGLYFLSFTEPDFAQSLYLSVKRELCGGILGFGLVKEYPAHLAGERGDIDSGPLILGYGISPTGFTIAGSRIYDDYHIFRRLYSTAYLCGAPYDSDGKRHFITGGHIGNAILFAMLTATPAERRNHQ